MKRATVSADGETITVHIPIKFRKRGGRKLVVTPDGAAWPPRPRVDNAMVKALARAFRWRKMLDDGVCGTLEDLATAKGVHATYASRVLRLTLLAPDIVEAMLDGRQPAESQLGALFEGFPLDWEEQRRIPDILGVCDSVCRTPHFDGQGVGPAFRCSMRAACDAR
jgi:hypothetical protein